MEWNENTIFGLNVSWYWMNRLDASMRCHPDGYHKLNGTSLCVSLSLWFSFIFIPDLFIKTYWRIKCCINKCNWKNKNMIEYDTSWYFVHFPVLSILLILSIFLTVQILNMFFISSINIMHHKNLYYLLYKLLLHSVCYAVSFCPSN